MRDIRQPAVATSHVQSTGAGGRRRFSDCSAARIWPEPDRLRPNQSTDRLVDWFFDFVRCTPRQALAFRQIKAATAFVRRQPSDDDSTTSIRFFLGFPPTRSSPPPMPTGPGPGHVPRVSATGLGRRGPRRPENIPPRDLRRDDLISSTARRTRAPPASGGRAPPPGAGSDHWAPRSHRYQELSEGRRRKIAGAHARRPPGVPARRDRGANLGARRPRAPPAHGPGRGEGGARGRATRRLARAEPLLAPGAGARPRASGSASRSAPRGSRALRRLRDRLRRRARPSAEYLEAPTSRYSAASSSRSRSRNRSRRRLGRRPAPADEVGRGGAAAARAPNTAASRPAESHHAIVPCMSQP